MTGLMAVQARVVGLNGEKLLNAARGQGITLKSVGRKKDRALVVRVSPRDLPAFRALAEERGFEISREEPVGLLAGWNWLRRRWGLMLGALLAAAMLIYALGFVWQVTVENAGPYLGEVRLFLEENGIRPGIRRSQVDLAALRDALTWRLPRVKWVRAEWRGVSLRIMIDEGTPPPEAASDQPGDVVAAEDGIVLWLAVYAGTPQAKPGDLVRAGQVLIRGEEKGAGGETRPVRARGEVMARVWISAAVRLPIKEYQSCPTGNQTERRLIQTPFFSWALADEPAYLTADKRVAVVPLGGAWLPVQLQREAFQEVYLEERERNLEDVKREGAKAALQRLDQLVIGEETVDKWLKFAMIERDTIEVEATAEVTRQIGRFCAP